MSSEKGSRLSQRHDPNRLDELKTISDESDIPQVALIAAYIRALYKTWTEEKQLVIPFRVVSESEWLEFKKIQQIDSGSRASKTYDQKTSEIALVRESDSSD